MDAVPCGIVIIGEDGKIALVNREAEDLFGYARAELIGSAVEVLLPERLRDLHESHRRGFFAAPLRRLMGESRELTARRKDGSEFPVEIGLSPMPGESGSLVLAAVTDITQRNALQLALRNAHANLEEFTYAASHDLKSPLRGISDLVEWIREDLGPGAPPPVVRNLGRVGDRVQRLEKVIDDLLSYALAGSTSANAVAVEPRALLEEVLEFLSLPAEFQVRLHIAASPFVTTRSPLETILRNLISNAAKHHDRAEGSLSIRVKDVDRYCVFTIADDGPGIPVASQEQVFQMFHTRSADKGEHSGIGLALSRRLAESNGGRIQLESGGTRGATFHVWWPRFQGRTAHE